MLKVCDVTKRYGRFTVLEHIDLEFTPGVYGLLAPNGAGKTTLMKMLTTLAFPTEGEIRYDGVEIRTMNAAYRDLLGYLPQQMGFYPNQSPAQFLTYLAALKGMEKDAVPARVEELLDLVGLSDVKRKRMRTFSGGMIQRVGIAQALLNDPKVLILDEPTAGLDPSERVRFRNIISGLSRDRIVILSTHIVSDVESVANQLIFLKDHRVAGEGSPESFCRDLRGKVFEITLPDAELPRFEQTHAVLSMRQEHDRVHLRFTGGSLPAEAVPTEPSLEDVFLVFYR